MPNTGLVNGELVDGTGETFFEGVIATFYQRVYHTLITEKSSASYNDYGYNTCMYNGDQPEIYTPIIIFNQRVGTSFSGEFVTFWQTVQFRSSYTDGPFIEFHQDVINTRPAGNMIRFRQRVYNA